MPKLLLAESGTLEKREREREREVKRCIYQSKNEVHEHELRCEWKEEIILEGSE